MTEPLFQLPTSSSGAALAVAAREHLQHLRDAGVLGNGHQLQAAIVTELATALAEPGKGYGKAQLAQALGQALDRLPVAQDADAWETWSQLAGQLTTPHARPAPPRFATRPTPGAAHQGDGVALVAALLGKPLMPWQRQVARVATERTPDGKRWKYRRIVVTVPRQSGKTTLLGALFVHRMLTRANPRVWMTAQTGRDATARWNDLRKLVTASPLADYTTTRLSSGSASLGFPRSDGFIAPFAPTPESLHGYTFDNVAVDEAFAFSLEEGTEILGAVGPAMITLPDHQIWVTSTAGGPESTWLRSLVEHGRANVDGGEVAYFEWSGDPTTSDYDFHPALGHTIPTLDELHTAAEALPPSERQRAFRNVWVESINEPLLPLEDLRNCPPSPGTPPPTDGTVRVAIGFDVDDDAGTSAIYAAWETDAGDVVTHPLSGARPGMAWLVEELTELADTVTGARLVTPPDGPSLEVADSLRSLGYTIDVLDGRSWATACGSLHRRIRRQDIVLAPNDQALVDAIIGAATRPLGDSWAISRRRSTKPVAAWGALAAAVRMIDTDGVHEFPLIEGASE